MKFKKMAAAGLVAVMAVSSLAGCGKKDDSSAGTTASGSTAAGSTASGSDAGQSAEKAKITMMCVDHSGNAFKNTGIDEILAEMEAYTNTEVDVNWVANDSYDDVLGVTLMDKKNMPMIITLQGQTMQPIIVQAAQNDAFWDLSQFLFDSEKYPNLSQASKDVLNALTVDGEIVGIYRSRPIGRNGLGYRADWAEKLGLGEPKTIEDIYNMAYQFTYGDPDGNGKDDTYGFAFCKYTGPLDIMQCWFGAGNGWAEQDGKLVPSHMTDEYMESLEWIKKMYDEGLVYEDWAVRDTNTWADSINTGECGMFLDVLDSSRRNWDYFVNNNIPSVVNPDEPASMKLVGGIAKDASSSPVTLATSGMNGYYVITKAAAKTEADVENCLHFLDKLCDNEMMLLADYGLKDRDWELDSDGYVVDLNAAMEVNTKPQNGLNQLLCYIPYDRSQDPQIKLNERQLIEEEVKKANVKIAVFNPAAGFLVNSATYSTQGADLDEIIKAARTQYVCGTIDKAGLEAQFQVWLDRGGQKVIDEINEMYAAQK